MCFNSSSSSASSSSSDVFDERVGADNGALAFRAQDANVTINDTSEQVSIAAIAGAQEALALGTDFIGKTFTQVLNLSDKRAEAAEKNSTATQAFASRVVEDATESADGRLIKIATYGGIMFVAVVALQSGVIKDLRGIFK